MYLISTTLVTGDHVSVVFAGGLVHTATTETAVVRHRETFGTRTISANRKKKRNKKKKTPNEINVFDGLSILYEREGGKNNFFFLEKQQTRKRRTMYYTYCFATRVSRETSGARRSFGDETRGTFVTLVRRRRSGGATFRERGDQHARRRTADWTDSAVWFSRAFTVRGGTVHLR